MMTNAFFKYFNLEKLVENCDEALLLYIFEYGYSLGENDGAFMFCSSNEYNEQIELFKKIKSYENIYKWNLNGKVQSCNGPVGNPNIKR